MSVKLVDQLFASDECEAPALRVSLVTRGFLVERVWRLVFRIEPVYEFGEVFENPLAELFWRRIVLTQFTDLFVARASNLQFELYEFLPGFGALGGEVLPFFSRHRFQILRVAEVEIGMLV